MGVKRSKLRYIHVDTHTHAGERTPQRKKVEEANTRCSRRSRRTKDLSSADDTFPSAVARWLAVDCNDIDDDYV